MYRSIHETRMECHHSGLSFAPRTCRRTGPHVFLGSYERRRGETCARSGSRKAEVSGEIGRGRGTSELPRAPHPCQWLPRNQVAGLFCTELRTGSEAGREDRRRREWGWSWPSETLWCSRLPGGWALHHQHCLAFRRPSLKDLADVFKHCMSGKPARI